MKKVGFILVLSLLLTGCDYFLPLISNSTSSSSSLHIWVPSTESNSTISSSSNLSSSYEKNSFTNSETSSASSSSDKVSSSSNEISSSNKVSNNSSNSIIFPSSNKVSSSSSVNNNEKKIIDIYAINDFHGRVLEDKTDYIPGISKLSTYLKEQKSKNEDGRINEVPY